MAGAEGLGRGLDLYPGDGLGEAIDAELGGALFEHLVGGIDLVGPPPEGAAAADGVVEPGLVPGDEARGHAGETVVAGPRVQPDAAVVGAHAPLGAATGVGQVDASVIGRVDVQPVAGAGARSRDGAEEPAQVLRQRESRRQVRRPQPHAVVAAAEPAGFAAGIVGGRGDEVEGVLEPVPGQGRRGL